LTNFDKTHVAAPQWMKEMFNVTRKEKRNVWYVLKSKLCKK